MPKKIRDPIYDYIEIEDEFLNIIDSVYFQRLRNIIQTSYTTVYPSALHNRFTHSLGVFWLGKLAFNFLIKNSENAVEGFTEKEILDTKKTFMMACLCHDLGHSPFSHTGEVFYDVAKMNEMLSKIVTNKSYKIDTNKGMIVVGKQHEIASALLSVDKFGEFIPDHGLFSRCITGLQYNPDTRLTKKEKKLLPLYKSCVELLNSTIIDVDKLDYLIRDSYMSGYSSVSIDYKRLLSGVFINNGMYPVGYEKNSLSVLESVLTAHDMERRWVQSHPAIQYEGYLLRTIIREISSASNRDGKELFSYETITEQGEELNSVGTIRLLSDADILFFAKRNYDESDAVKEYFNRSLRRHPIWKSEAEFSLLFDFKRNEIFMEILKTWEQKLLEGAYGVYSINDTFYSSISNEINEVEKLSHTLTKESQQSTLNSKLKKLKIELDILKQIKECFEEEGIPFDFVIVTQQQFKSNIYKSAFKELPIRFNSKTNIIKQMKDVSFTPFDTQEDKKTFFYLYYKRCNGKKIDANKFSIVLRKASIIQEF